MGRLEQILNLKYRGKSNMSIVTALLIFYIVVSNSLTNNLHSHQLTDFVNSNRWVQHVIGSFIMMVIMVKIAGINNGWVALLYTLISYGWFILTTKLNLEWILTIILLLVVGFIYENKIFERENDIHNDESLEEQDKLKIKKKNKLIKKILILSIAGITILGTIFYAKKKTIQYGGNFDPTLFLLGDKN